MMGLTWSRIGVVVVLVIAVAAVVQLKEQHRASSPSQPAAPVTNKAAAVPRLLDLGSTSCIPCKMMAPILEDLRKSYAGRLQVDFVDVWKDAQAAEKYGVRSIPTQIFFDAKGKELYRHTGFWSRDDILARFRDLGINL